MLSSNFTNNQKWMKLFEITMAVYRVTNVFPKDEILKIQLRGAANKLFAFYSQNFLGKNASGKVIEEFLGNINYIRSLLFIAKENNYSSGINFIVLDREYKIFSNETEKEFVKREDDFRESQKKETQKQERNEIPEDKVCGFENKIVENPVKALKPVPSVLNDRQEKIMKIFREQIGQRIKLGDISKFFPEFSQRTVRKDLRFLSNKNLINKNDSFGQNSFYWISE